MTRMEPVETLVADGQVIARLYSDAQIKIIVNDLRKQPASEPVPDYAVVCWNDALDAILSCLE